MADLGTVARPGAAQRPHADGGRGCSERSRVRIPTKPATHSEVKAATLPERGGEQGSWWIEVAALRPVNGR